MATNLSELSAEQRIFHTEEDCYDVMYWSIKLGVSIDQLLEAIAKAGSLVPDVERHLNACRALAAQPLAPNPVRHVLHFPGLSGTGPAERKIVQPDPPVFVVHGDRPDGPERAATTSRAVRERPSPGSAPSGSRALAAAAIVSNYPHSDGPQRPKG